MSNHCLVCGNQNAGKKYLIGQLASNAKFNCINKNHYECVWKIVNKYYESDVTFTIINSIDLLNTKTNNSNNNNDETETKESENRSNKINLSQFSAIILVLNLNQTQYMIQKDLDLWLNVLSPQLSLSDCCLLMGNYINSHANTGPIHEHKRKEYHQFLHNFCVDNYFEFVPSPFNIKNTNDFYGYNSSLFASYDAMEVGYHRINSALQCVMWPNMSRNPPTKSSNYNTMQPLLSAERTDTHKKYDDTNTICEEKVKEAENIKITKTENKKSIFKKGDKVVLKGLQSKQKWNGKSAEIVGHFSQSKQRWPVELEVTENKEKIVKKVLIKSVNLVLCKEERTVVLDEEKVNETEIETETETEDKNKEIENKEFMEKILWNANENLNDNKNKNKNKNKTKTKNESDGALETKMKSFQSLISEMQQVRNDAKSGKLSDDQRRQRAADTAMKLMSYMGLDENQNNNKKDKDKANNDNDNND